MGAADLALLPVDVESKEFGKPVITYTLIGLNVLIYLLTTYENSFIEIGDYWVRIYALTPFTLLYNEWYRIITSMFLHQNIFHIFFNMYFLYIFGREVEGTLGHLKYLTLYMLSGIFASLFHVSFISVLGLSNLFIPALGASGAISGVLGAFILLYPHRDLTVCWFFWFIPWCFTAKAVYLLLLWFGMQVILGYTSMQGVAFFAHAGGFIAGIALLPVLIPSWIKRERVKILYDHFLGEYILIRRRGIERKAKILFQFFIILLLLGSIYSLHASYALKSDVYSYLIGVYGEETVISDYTIYSPSGGVLTYPMQSLPRIVWNRIYWADLVSYKPNYEGILRFNSLVDAPKYNVKVRVDLDAYAEYDSNGILKFMNGTMVTDVIYVRGVRISLERNVMFRFELSSYGPIEDAGPKLIAPASILSITILIIASAVVLTKDREIVID
ncbi:hypothetical protein DRN84_01380 [Candidatus Geothermarchaeota archaeon]|nr:MAG: hypothetical protein DRN87_00725 [Candidatus Geothermarchaeota archaeon]RLG62636.1 MAG: hypothetical protein DRN84_01380 [Candidatus Geothermarchaeota archaeon]